MSTPMIYKTGTMLLAMKKIPLANTFLRDRYFPTAAPDLNGMSNDIFPGEEVLVDYMDGEKKLAPFVVPRIGGVLVERDGYKTYAYTPAQISPKRTLTIDDLNKRGFGEKLYSQLTPEQRQASVLRNDLVDFDKMISRSEEYMVAQCLQNNGYDLKREGGEDYQIRFYDESSNPSVYTPSKTWDQADADIYGDIGAMIQMLVSEGLPVEDLIMKSQVADLILTNTKMQKLLDIRNISLGTIQPTQLPKGAAIFGVVNIKGRMINLITYDETYKDPETGNNVSYIDDGNVIAAAPALGRTVYGAVTQLEDDEQFHTHMGKRIPKYSVDQESEVRKLKVTSRPLVMPKNKNSFVVSKVI